MIEPRDIDAYPSGGARRASRPRERGIALVIVLWIIVVLGLQVSLFNASIRDGITMIENDAAMVRGQVLMLAAVEVAVGRLLTTDERQRWSGDGGSNSVRFGGAELNVSINDENGRVNLNVAEAPLIEGVMRIATGSAREAARLTDRVIRRRGGETDRRSGGGAGAFSSGAVSGGAGAFAPTPAAGDAQRRAAAANPAGTGVPFVDVNDLVRDLAMPNDQAERLARLLTLYTANGTINPLLASEQVLRALPNVPVDSIVQVLRLRTQGGATPGAITALLAPAAAYLNTSRGPAYRIRVQVSGNRRTAVGSIEVIVALKVDGGAPYRILAWRSLPNASGETGASTSDGTDAKKPN